MNSILNNLRNAGMGCSSALDNFFFDSFVFQLVLLARIQTTATYALAAVRLSICEVEYVEMNYINIVLHLDISIIISLGNGKVTVVQMWSSSIS